LSATLPATSAGALFAGSPHTLEELQGFVKNGEPLPAFPLAVNVRATTTTKVISTADAPNVVAELEGSDPRLKHEYLVLSAHLDHLGVGRPVDGDPIYHGAMDNASGIASLIETAKALANGPRPKRSVIFLALTGEEEGELGQLCRARRSLPTSTWICTSPFIRCTFLRCRALVNQRSEMMLGPRLNSMTLRFSSTSSPMRTASSAPTRLAL
jgi:hypothetical protein